MTTQSYIALLGLYTIASFLGVANYFFFRLVERKLSDFGMVIASWEIVFLFISGYFLFPYFKITGSAAILFFLISGSWLHFKSGGSSYNQLESFGLMFLAIQTSLFWGFVFFNITPFFDTFYATAIVTTSPFVSNVAFYLGCATGPWVTVALLAGAQSFNLRPGLDVPFQPETIES